MAQSLLLLLCFLVQKNIENKATKCWTVHVWTQRKSHVDPSVNIIVMLCPHLLGMLYGLQVIAENIKGVRAAKGIFKATFPALRNMQTQTTHEAVQSPRVYSCKNWWKLKGKKEKKKLSVYSLCIILNIFVWQRRFCFHSTAHQKADTPSDRAEKQ